MHTPNSNHGVCFVIPTYNEADNITDLLKKLLHLDPDWQILIADDNSPDGTAARVQAVRAQAENAKRIHISSGEKRGLGSAYKRAMVVALEELDAKIIIQMDADFSHDPSQAISLIKHIRDGADIAIGSRYIKNAMIDARWHLFRRYLSAAGNWLARHIAGIKGVRDCTSGFRAIDCNALKRIAVAKLPVNGYAFQIALLHRLLYHDALAVEYPIYFAQRASGKTKLGWFDLFEFFVGVWMLRFPSARTFIKFSLVGCSGILINLSVFYLFINFGMNRYIASPLAVELSILSNFYFNNAWTFSERELLGNKLVRGVAFNTISLGTLLMSFATFIMLSATLSGERPLLYQAISIIPAALFNYFINSYWTFRDATKKTN